MKQFTSALQFIKKHRVWLLVGLIIFAVLYSFINKATKRNSVANPIVTPSPIPLVSTTAQPTLVSTSSPAPSPAPTTSSITPTTSPTVSLSSQLIPVAGSAVDLDSASQTLYWLDPISQTFKKMDMTTRAVTEVGTVPAYLDAAIWSPDHTKLFVAIRNTQTDELPNPLYRPNIKKNRIPAIYDPATSKLTELNANIISISFLGNQKIIYQYKDDRYNNLSVANLDGSSWKNIATPQKNTWLLWSGNTALSQVVNTTTVSRHDRNGKTTETYTVPSDFQLNQSVWSETGKSAVYWLKKDGQFIIKQIKATGEAVTLESIDIKEDDYSILWDNSNKVVYLVTFDGIRQVTTTE
jgi:hypothetical protein